jgi:multidrug efflux pump subunit AcrA (membrane-fusion protein)
VYIVENGIARRRSVETGAIRQDRVEIVKGLATGDQVISAGGFNVSDGVAVKVRNVN